MDESSKQLGGWARIGIVLSVIWVGVIAALVCAEWRLAAPYSVHRRYVDYVPDPSKPPVQEVATDGRPITLTPVTRELVWEPIARDTVVPIAAAWLATLIIVAVVRWVRRGFQTPR
jgi:hypothetical protein